MHHPDLEERLRSGGAMVSIGIVVLVLTLFGTCAAAMSNAGDPNPAASGMETGQSPLLLIGLTLGVALIVLGQVRKANARNKYHDRYIEENTEVEVVLDEQAPDGPFRGAMKEVEVLDPIVAAAEAEKIARAKTKGSIYLAIGGSIMVLTIVCLMLFARGAGDGAPGRAFERVMSALGLSLIPFGIGMYFGIRGLLLRSQ